METSATAPTSRYTRSEPRPVPGQGTRSSCPRAGVPDQEAVLGPPLNTDRLEHERLGKPDRAAVFASDNLSSSAYATEEILRVLVAGRRRRRVLAVVPITSRCSCVLGFLILSYRQTIKAYPTAGGAYIVTRDNFGLLPAQVAGCRVLTDYVLTVAVSVAAGTAALASAFHRLVTPYEVPISVAFLVVIAFGNLKGVRESGQIFSRSDLLLHRHDGAALGVGLYGMSPATLPTASEHARVWCTSGSAGDGVFFGAALFVSCKAFASGVPRSPASRPSPTACRRSRSRSGRTPDDPRRSWAARSARCSSGSRSSPRTCTSRRTRTARRPSSPRSASSCSAAAPAATSSSTRCRRARC